ncbi:hypothetical protein NDU88_007407 [Pleurodeles waltl]|uniref:Secreted protein n=1 Tax=Pleurodeles waltl TaxID=8319 RepID=A0AAV7VQQ3_PLEWA|nr:hypothetical protein NDU88_007407 [Pleurodeles waltl]
MVVTSAAVTSAVVRIITASAPIHWLLGPIGSNVNQCSIALRSTTAYRDGVQRQRSYPTIPMSQFRAMCTANGVPRLKDRRVDSCVVIVWAYSCWCDGGGFVIASLSLTFGVADLCGSLDFGGFRAVGHNGSGGILQPRLCVGGLLHDGKRLLPPML